MTGAGVRSDSMFEDSKLQYTKIVGLLHYWSFSIGVTTTAQLLGLDERTVRLWHKVKTNLSYH